MSFLNPSRKKSEEVRVREIRFLGEQDGPPERLLKEKLADFFRRDGSVSRAYLARVDFGEGKNASVVLGIRPDSIFYNMERMETKGYENYLNVFERTGRFNGQ